jgi:hypothetical protein
VRGCLLYPGKSGLAGFCSLMLSSVSTVGLKETAGSPAVGRMYALYVFPLGPKVLDLRLSHQLTLIRC